MVLRPQGQNPAMSFGPRPSWSASLAKMSDSDDSEGPPSLVVSSSSGELPAMQHTEIEPSSASDSDDTVPWTPSVVTVVVALAKGKMEGKGKDNNGSAKGNGAASANDNKGSKGKKGKGKGNARGTGMGKTGKGPGKDGCKGKDGGKRKGKAT